MLHMKNAKVKELALQGNFGLERENLRILRDGSFSHIPHPFSEEEKQIVYDFCENQLEVNTAVSSSAEEVILLLERHTDQIQKRLAELEEPELLWPFSNPPLIRNEDDIPIARDNEITGHEEGYRKYLSDRYGRYKMSLSGIHVNYSFSDELLQADFQASGEEDFFAYKNKLYIHVAEGACLYGWILTAVTAASPLLDGSYLEKGKQGKTVFNGMASTRCSELGYWNYFTPVLSYSSLEDYADSIQGYVDVGLIIAPSELYYPIRLKPKGKNHMDLLKENGVDHIELRMVDLNPYEYTGINQQDLLFIQLFLVWIAGSEHPSLKMKDQVQAVQNFKNAAHYDLKTVKIEDIDGQILSLVDAGKSIISSMREFYQGYPAKIQNILDYEEEKFIDPEKRYAWKIRREYGEDFVNKGLELAWKYQKQIVE